MPSTTVVINEVATRGPGGLDKPRPLDEFIELRNISAGDLRVGNWQVVACTSTGGEVLLATIPANLVMRPKGQVGQFFLVANADGYTGSTPPDLTYSGVAIEDLGGVELRKDEIDPITGKGVRVDAVGFLLGLLCVEGAPAQAQAEDDDPQALANSRDAESTDRDVNAIDFRQQARSPRNKNSLS